MIVATPPSRRFRTPEAIKMFKGFREAFAGSIPQGLVVR
jgi:hypothetical protein